MTQTQQQLLFQCLKCQGNVSLVVRRKQEKLYSFPSIKALQLTNLQSHVPFLFQFISKSSCIYSCNVKYPSSFGWLGQCALPLLTSLITGQLWNSLWGTRKKETRRTTRKIGKKKCHFARKRSIVMEKSGKWLFLFTNLWKISKENIKKNTPLS